MVGGEIVAGQAIEAIWDGSQYQLLSRPALGHVPGEVFDYAGAACPVGSLETTGSSLVSQTAYPTLYANITTLWGAAAGGNFTIPDLRGRTTYSRDSGGSGRITVGGSGIDGTVVGATGGIQEQQLISTAQLPPYTPSGTVSVGAAIISVSTGTFSGGGSPAVASATSGNPSGSFSGTPVGSSSPFSTLSNGAIVLKCIKG